MIFAREPYLLHLLAGSETITALDAAKSLLDSGYNDPNEREPTDNISPLHVAAAWNNLAMCQLLIHYGADVNARDIDKRRPVDVADKQCKQFLRRLHKRRRTDKSKFRKVLSYLFRGICASSSAANKSVLIDSPRKDVTTSRKSCIANIHTDNQKDKRIKYPTTVFARPMPSAPRRPSSLINEEFLTSDNTDDGREIENKITENEDKPQVNGNELNENADCEKSQDQENKEDEEEIEEGFEVLDPAEEAAFKKQLEQEEELCKQFSALKLDDLKARLRCKNFKTGPMDARNRKVYEAKLAKFEFISSIFYVGKGKRSRPLQHLIHASKCRNFAKTRPSQRTEKLKRILQLWDRGEGVISMHLFHNIHSAEAFIREGAMIEAIGTSNLTNIVRGTFPEIASNWTRQQITEFGSLLLHKAFVIFLNERCRPIFEADINEMDGRW
uniref:LEM domain-containing protein n=1 Tax=Meloidogyne javanica TaxID=6303 RepID=A0A915N859_MELJA